MKTVIIAGCAGFIGTNLTKHLINKGYRVIGIDDLSNSSLEFLPKVENFIFYNFSLEINEITSEVINQICKDYEPIVLYNLVGVEGNIISPFIRNFYYKQNLILSSILVNECIKHNLKLIFASSSSVYGEENPPFNENILPKPNSPYSISKYASELDIINAGDFFNLKYNILRLDRIIGLYHNINNCYNNVIFNFCKNISSGKPIQIYGDGLQTRSFLDIQYLLDPLTLLIENFDNEIFNIGSENYYSINKIADIFLEYCKNNQIKSEKNYLPNIKETKNIFCDISKSKSLLNFQDKTDIKKSIIEIIEWSKNQKYSIQNPINYEISKKLYQFLPPAKKSISVNIDIEEKEYFNESSKRYRKSYGRI